MIGKIELFASDVIFNCVNNKSCLVSFVVCRIDNHLVSAAVCRPEIFTLTLFVVGDNLVCNVKKDNWKQYLDGSAKIYYTGKRFPTTVALNKLYYFMPYLSGKGIRDLYYIKIARLGYRKEGQENEDKNDLRLVFEIERVGQLFSDYKKVKLEIWRTFTDTTIEKIL